MSLLGISVLVFGPWPELIIKVVYIEKITIQVHKHIGKLPRPLSLTFCYSRFSLFKLTVTARSKLFQSKQNVSGH